MLRSTLHIQSPSYSHKRLPYGRAFHHRLGIPSMGSMASPIRIAYAIKGSITFIRAFFLIGDYQGEYLSGHGTSFA